jgi:hypothetical protein
MKMVCAIFLVAVMTVVAVLFISRADFNEKLSVIQITHSIPKTVEFHMTLVDTCGNHSYAPINYDGDPADIHIEILEFLNVFEKQHPELEVYDWKIEKQQASHSANRYVYGIWIDHRSKK